MNSGYEDLSNRGCRLIVEGWPLSILDTETEMPSVPHGFYPSTLEPVDRIRNAIIGLWYSAVMEVQKEMSKMGFELGHS